MASTYSPSLRIELIGPGEQAGTWNTTTNTNLGTLIESAIAGYVSVSITSANQALTAIDGAVDQARNAMVALTTTTVAAFAVYIPPQEKQYIIWNTTAYDATIYNSTVLGNTTPAGAGVVVPAGSKLVVFSTGTVVYTIDVKVDSISGVLPVAKGGTGVVTSTGTGDVVLSNAPTLVDVTATGITLLGDTGVGTATPAGRFDVDGNQVSNIVPVAALDIDCTLGNYFTKTVAATSTFTFSNPPASRVYSFTLELTFTSGSVTWPATVQWPGGVTPLLTAGKTNLFMFVTDDSGTRWRGASLVNYTT